MKRKRIIDIALGGLSLLMTLTAATAAEPREFHVTPGQGCEVCGMYIEEFRKTAVEIVFSDGRREDFCGVACALRRINEYLGMPQVKSAYASDWNTQAAIPLEQAVLVVDSDQTPDMIPNFIAFASKAEADAFRKDHGGQIIALERALATISYQGMTMPFRITTAATPPARVFSVGASVGGMVKDHLMEGGHDVSSQDALKTRTMVPKKMVSTMTAVNAGYAFTDDIYSDIALPYCWKQMTSIKKTGEQTTFKEDGPGDVQWSGRWRFYHDELYDQHFALVLRAGLPTGEFTQENRARPGMQIGTGAFSGGGGLLFSQHLGLFWLHGSAEYRYNFENTRDYKFGDIMQVGTALHFTPSTKTMLGLEFDASKAQKNEDNGSRVANTGCEGVYGSLVCQQRLATFWGGNFDLRAMIGIPLYEYVEDVQLGETFHYTAGVQWKRRF